MIDETAGKSQALALEDIEEAIIQFGPLDATIVEQAREISRLRTVLRNIVSDCERTDPDDLVAGRALLNRIYATARKAVP